MAGNAFPGLSPLIGQILFGGGISPLKTPQFGTPPFFPGNPGATPPIAPSSGIPGAPTGFFDKADQFLSGPSGNFLMNLLAQEGFSTTPQSPLAAIGRAGLMTAQQRREAQMSDLQRRLIESQIGRNQTLATNPASGNVQSTFEGSNGNMFIVTRDGNVKDTGVKFNANLRIVTRPDGSAVLVDPSRGANTQPVEVVSPEEAVSGAAARTSAEAAAQVEGKSGAEARRDLPKAESRTQQLLGQLDQLESHPGFSGAVGAKGAESLFGLRDTPVAGTDEADFVAMVDQIGGTLFLEAFQELKGGGHITEIEGQKAEQAMARIRNRDQSERGYRQAIKELREILRTGIERKRRAAGVEGPTAAPASGAPIDVTKLSDEELRRLASGGTL